ncbi:DUF805 domain-containing protein [Aeromicrobium sp. SMF47]|uniref:DUF805 domain-containing protein n=1 Tax=Aeromicrobium yanjiei TaxID=2662028 RepID=UPI00129D5968|nr:DUF805 domain-containing protein [Aeromicrobium yanjiei]MRJ77029.1 DUF805 domain-containing protein [Aeromicrobium yanjiei]
MNMQEAVRSVLSQYASFSGRARRSEFWFWALATFLVSIVASIIDLAIGVQIVAPVLALALLVPNLAVGARRLHDTGRSGWWQLIAFIPIIGFILLIVWWATDSQGSNQYGPSPKDVAPGPYGSAPYAA